MRHKLCNQMCYTARDICFHAIIFHRTAFLSVTGAGAYRIHNYVPHVHVLFPLKRAFSVCLHILHRTLQQEVKRCLTKKLWKQCVPKLCKVYKCDAAVREDNAIFLWGEQRMNIIWAFLPVDCRGFRYCTYLRDVKIECYMYSSCGEEIYTIYMQKIVGVLWNNLKFCGCVRCYFNNKNMKC
jgi:hypothetical protein